MYSCTAAGWKQEEQQKLEIKTILPPMPTGFDEMSPISTKGLGGFDGRLDSAKVNGSKKGWELVGVWGQADIVVQHIGMIWGRVE